LLFKFLWNGVDKVTRVSAINDYERGSLKMIYVDCMIRSLRLAWLQRVFNDSSATWKRYFHVGGILNFLRSNFDVKILIYALHTTTNFCNGGQNFVIPLLKKSIIKT